MLYIFCILSRKYTSTSKVPDTRGCIRCCVGRNPYNGYKYLCGALPNGVILMQWYEPLNKFMQLKVCNIAIDNRMAKWILCLFLCKKGHAL